MKSDPAPDGSPTIDAPTAEELISDRDFLALYEAAFPEDQREPIAVIAQTLRTEHGVVLRARAAGKTIGLASAHLIEAPPAVFLVYLAVSPAWRGRRLGSDLFERIWQVGAARLRNRHLPPLCYVWEVEQPELAATETERALARQRIVFFQHRGGSALLSGYHQPPVNGPAPVPMLLMARPAADRPLPAPREIVRGVYFEKYGAANGIDPKILTSLLDRSLRPEGTPPAGKA